MENKIEEHMDDKTIKAYVQEIVLKPYLDVFISRKRKEATVLNPEASFFFHENISFYLLRKDISRKDLSKKIGMNISILKKNLTGERNKKVNLDFAQDVADAIDVNLEQLIAPLLFYIKPEIKHFLIEKTNTEYVYAMMKYISGKNIKQLIDDFKEVKNFDISLKADKSGDGILSYNDSAVFKENLEYYLVKKKKSKKYITKKLETSMTSLRRYLAREIKLDFAKKVAKALNVKFDELLAPQLFYVDPYIRRFVHEDGNIQYVYALMNYIKGDDNLIQLGKKIKEIKRKKK